MPAELSPIDKAKFVAAKRAVDFVESGMKVGLGTGSTAAWMVRCLGERVREEGMKIVGVPTSTRTAELARQVGVPITSLDDAKWLDVTIDGAKHTVAPHTDVPVSLAPCKHALETATTGKIDFIVYVNGKGGIINPTFGDYVVVYQVSATSATRSCGRMPAAINDMKSWAPTAMALVQLIPG